MAHHGQKDKRRFSVLDISNEKLISRDSDLTTTIEDVDIFKKMWIYINISTSHFNISTSCVNNMNISTSLLNISTSTEMWILLDSSLFLRLILALA